MRTSLVLEKALELLGPNGENWFQGDWESADHSKCCAMGMIRRVTKHGEIASTHECLEFLSRAAGLYGEPRIGKIGRWNDRSTFHEVKAAFEKAISLAKQEEVGG